MRTYQAGADRPNYSKAEKRAFPSYRIRLSVTLHGLDHVTSCHSEFSNQFSKSELHGGLAEEPGLMCRAVVTFRINIIQY